MSAGPAHVTGEAGRARLRQAGWRAGQQGSQPEPICSQKSLCLGHPVLSRTKPSRAWVRPTRSAQGPPLYSEPTDFNASAIEETPHGDVETGVRPDAGCRAGPRRRGAPRGRSGPRELFSCL